MNMKYKAKVKELNNLTNDSLCCINLQVDHSPFFPLTLSTYISSPPPSSLRPSFSSFFTSSPHKQPFIKLAMWQTEDISRKTGEAIYCNSSFVVTFDMAFPDTYEHAQKFCKLVRSTKSMFII